MALTPRQRWLVLGGGLALTLIAVVWLGGDEAGDSKVVAVTKPERGSSSRKPEQAAQPEVLALQFLKRQLPEDKPEDAFSAKSWYVPPPPPKPVPPPPPAPPPMPFSYMGRIVEDGKTTLFLTKQDRSYAVKVGDVIDGAYRVDAIDMGGVTLTYLPLKMQQTLATGGSN